MWKYRVVISHTDQTYLSPMSLTDQMCHQLVGTIGLGKVTTYNDQIIFVIEL